MGSSASGRRILLTFTGGTTDTGTWNSSIVPHGNNEWTTTLGQMGRKIQVASLISHTPELQEGPQIFERIADGSFGSFGRIIFRIRP